MILSNVLSQFFIVKCFSKSLLVDKKIVGKRVFGICRAAKAAGDLESSAILKTCSSHTPTASFWSSLCLRMSLSSCLCNKCEHALCLCLYLCLCLCRFVNQAFDFRAKPPGTPSPSPHPGSTFPSFTYEGLCMTS